MGGAGEGGDATLSCLPDRDGAIAAEELSPALGMAARFYVGTQRPVDLAGVVDVEGLRVWDFTSDPSTDSIATFEARPIVGAWYADRFPDGQVATPIDAAGTLQGIYRHDDQALWLLGIASTTADPPEGRTLLAYVEPVAVFRFPLTPGAAWTSVGEVQGGTYRGVPYHAVDTYEVRIDAVGHVALPDWSFDGALRARTTVTVDPALAEPLVTRQTSFLFECFGEVARATSATGETEDDFTTAAELRRRTF